MSPPIDKQTEKELEKLFYEDKYMFGRDKLYKIAINKGINISRRQVYDWLKKQEIHQLYFPAEKSKELQSTVLNKPHDQIGIDLIDMQNYEFNNYKYILTGIDLFSKKGYVVALKDKSQREVNKGIREIIKESNPRSIRSDNGSEFISQSFKDILKNNNIKQVLSSPGLPQSNGQVERFNGILKNLINKDLMYSNTYNWYKPLSKLIDNYNNTYQTTIRDTPNNIDALTDEVRLSEIRKRIYNTVISKRGSLSKSKFKIGDKVTLKMYNEKTKQNWSNEIYIIEKVHKSRKLYSVPYYSISNINDNKIIDKKYYDNDLQYIPEEIKNKTNKVQKYEISKILDFKRKNGKDYYLIQWKGFSQKTFEPYETLILDVPKMLKAFDKKNNIVH